MANSRYPVTVGAKNGGNGAQLRALRSGMGWAWGPAQWWSEIFDITRAGALDADTDQTFDLHTYNPNNLFPANVFRGPALLRPLTNVGGGAISAVTAQLGDTNDTDGLVSRPRSFPRFGSSSPAATLRRPRPAASSAASCSGRSSRSEVTPWPTAR
jgi:hypothetical protein